MVERHVFMPAQESEKEVQADGAKTINPKELQRQVIFSGVIIGPKGKKALIRETGNKTADASKNKPYSIGDQIKGMTIKEIGSNHIVLAGQEGETKLNLYNGGKPRPSPPVIAPEPPVQPPQAPGMTIQPNLPNPSQALPLPETSVQAPGTAINKPLQGPVPGPVPEAGGSKIVPGGDPSANNPFADAIKKAAERKANRADQPSENVANPFGNLTQ
jgi:hypothetical protein